MDNLTKAQRSFNMSRIRSKGTKIEESFFKLLEENNISYIKYPKIFGKPDCQVGENVLVFIESDFWHGWHFSKWKDRLPKNYWVAKIESNIKRDKKKFRVLRNRGYKIVRIWEHSIKQRKIMLNKIKQFVKVSN